jgi:hypothetical protein
MHYTDNFTLGNLDALTEESTGPCVSLFLPTHAVSNHTDADRILLKNLRTEAHDALLARGVRRTDADDLLEPVDALLEDDGFWPFLSEGLAIFCGPGYQAHYRLPVRFEPSARVSHRYVVKPLFPLFSDDGNFAILALSRNEIRLFEGSRHAVHEVQLKDMPESMSSALRIRHRPNLSPSGPLQGQEGQKEKYRLYFLQVDRALRPWLTSHGCPLVLAGVDHLLPIYRSASHYRQIVAGGIHGNPEQLRPEELHEKAWPLVASHFAAPRHHALAKYQSLIGTGRTSQDLKEVLNAALDGRVEALFVRTSAEVFGKYDYATRTATILPGDEPGGVDLVARAARLAHATGASVFAGEPPDVPDVPAVAAVLRF